MERSLCLYPACYTRTSVAICLVCVVVSYGWRRLLCMPRSALVQGDASPDALARRLELFRL